MIPPPPASRPSHHVDLDLLRLDLLGLGKGDGQHPVPIARLDLLGLDWDGQREGSLELPEPPLAAVVVLLLDLLVPAAIGGAITSHNQDRVRCRLLAEAANNPVTPDAERALEARGITILPDFVANAAAAFLFCGLLEKRLEPNLDSIFTVTSRQLRSTTRELLERARRQRVSNRRAAEEIAEGRLRARPA